MIATLKLPGKALTHHLSSANIWRSPNSGKAPSFSSLSFSGGLFLEFGLLICHLLAFKYFTSLGNSSMFTLGWLPWLVLLALPA